MQADTYIATKELVINGTVVPKGKPLPAKIDPERLAAGLNSGKIVRQRPAPPAPLPVTATTPVTPPAAAGADAAGRSAARKPASTPATPAKDGK